MSHDREGCFDRDSGCSSLGPCSLSVHLVGKKGCVVSPLFLSFLLFFYDLWVFCLGECDEKCETFLFLVLIHSFCLFVFPFYYLLLYPFTSIFLFVFGGCIFFSYKTSTRHILLLSPIHLLHCPCCQHKRSPLQHCSQVPSSLSGIHSASSVAPWCIGRYHCTS